MKPRAFLLLVVALIGCVHTISSSRETEGAPRFGLAVRMDETFDYAMVELMSADGGILYSERVDSGQSWINTSLSAGPSSYVVD